MSYIEYFQHNQWADGYAEQDSWIWWLLIFCGKCCYILI